MFVKFVKFEKFMKFVKLKSNQAVFAVKSFFTSSHSSSIIL